MIGVRNRLFAEHFFEIGGYIFLEFLSIKLSYSVIIKIWGGSIIDALQVNHNFYGTDNPNPANLNEIILQPTEMIEYIKYARYIGSVTTLYWFLGLI